jgi:hypothetical protein
MRGNLGKKRCKITQLMRLAALKRDREHTRFQALRPPHGRERAAGRASATARDIEASLEISA